MLCDECAVRPAGVTITLFADGETHQRHLCGACLERVRQSIDSGDALEMLMTLSPLMTDAGDETPPLVCDACGMTYERFIGEGVFGCPKCYEAFRERLAPLEKRLGANGRDTPEAKPAPAMPDIANPPAARSAEHPRGTPDTPTERNEQAAPEAKPASIASEKPSSPDAPIPPPLTPFYQAAAAAPHPTALHDMEAALAEAVALEQYERAASLRDALRARKANDRPLSDGKEASHG